MAQHQQQQEDTMSHFSHPGHELVKRHYVGPSFLCDMCCESLSGPGYGCGARCDFGIHETCAGHPQALTSPAHHAHPLALVQTRRDGAAALACDVCAGRCAPGCFLYRCPPCGFDMHPRCARLPRAVRSGRHPEHDLALVVADDDGRCAAACGAGGLGLEAWYYRCAECSVDFHVSCAATVADAVADAHADADAVAHADAVAYVDAYANAFTHADAVAYVDAYANAFTRADAVAYVDAYANAVTYADADTVANKGDDADADADADADTVADTVDDADTVIEQIHQASAAQMRIQAAMMQARIRVQGSRNALDLVSPSYPESYTVRRDYFF